MTGGIGKCLLTERTGLVQQTVSKHLGVLLRAGIVTRRKQGGQRLLPAVDDSGFEVGRLVVASIEQQWSALGRELNEHHD